VLWEQRFYKRPWDTRSFPYGKLLAKPALLLY
jgi:hypothetical protein